MKRIQKEKHNLISFRIFCRWHTTSSGKGDPFSSNEGPYNLNFAQACLLLGTVSQVSNVVNNSLVSVLVGVAMAFNDVISPHPDIVDLCKQFWGTDLSSAKMKLAMVIHMCTFPSYFNTLEVTCDIV